MKLSERGADFIKAKEGLRLEAYQCEAGKWTIGYGHRRDVKEGMRITEHQAEVVFTSDAESFEDGVSYMTKDVDLTQSQFDALVSLAFNIGVTRFATSNLLRKLKRGDVAGAAEEFAKWRLADGKVSEGLVKRRAEEKAMFLEGFV